MIDHISIGVTDLAASGAFYDVVLATLGLERLVTRDHTFGYGKKYPEFWINHRPGMAAADDTGVHVCIRTRSQDSVIAFHQAALDAGGKSVGAPGIRPHHIETYYAAFIGDLDGNRIEAVTF